MIQTLAILICNQHKFEGKHIWMEVGNFTNNSLRFIDVTLHIENLGVESSKSNPAFHAFTGCDYSSAFVGKGKNPTIRTACQRSWMPKRVFQSRD